MKLHAHRRHGLIAVVAAVALAGPLLASQAAASPRAIPLEPAQATAESVNLALADGAVASARSQRQTAPALTYAPANATDVFVHNGWTSNYASVGAGYDPTDDWFQVELAEPAPVFEVFILWSGTSKPSTYDLLIASDADCSIWTPVAHVVDPPNQDSHVIDRSEPISCVRMQASATNSTTGYTINEFEIWSGPKPAPVVGEVIPVPVSQTAGTGSPFELTADSRLVISDDELAGTAELLAQTLRPATGFALPVEGGVGASANDIELTIGDVDGLPAGDEVAEAEAYTLDASANGVEIVAPSAHGVFNGFQSLRQLLPAAISSAAPSVGPWTIDPISIFDYPRYAHRGLQLDPARNFLTVDETKAMIDQFAALKGSRLHLHLSDSQSWRLEVKGYPALDGRGCNGSGCIAGFYTQDDFADIVAYANERFIEVVPELESPAHATAAVTALGGISVVGCTGQTQTDRFCTDPNDPASQRALEFWREAIRQLAEISPGPIIHIGGDEAIGMNHDNYKWWIRQMEIIVNDNGKTMMGWNPALEGYDPDSTSINHYWSDYTGGGPALIKPEWFDHGRDVIVTPEYNAYLDFGYDTSPGRTPRTELLQSYSWDPEWVYEKYRSVWAQPAYGGPRAEDILGLEAPIWGEQMRGLGTNQYMVFPRLAGILEKAWSPKVLTQDYDAYRQRLAVAGARWAFADVNYGTISQVAWGTSTAGSVVEYGVDRTVTAATVARLAAGALSPTAVSAVIDWGDGSAAEAAAITGRDYTPAQRQGRDPIAASGTHTFPAEAVYHGTVMFTAGDQSWSVPFRAEPYSIDLAVTAEVRCIANNAYVAVRAVNLRPEPVGIELETPFGSRTVANVAANGSAFQTFNVRATSVEVGTAVVTGTRGGDSRTIEVSYPATACGG
ncbi:beta-N-acetylhexosaminidase [Agromyces intestinalis]|nr:beta-N-acetylhexosaminidase [Agromyces intestinalis]